MLIGVISDTHDNIDTTKRAVELFNSKGIEYLIHAGDITSPFTLKLFKDLKCRYAGVFGNNDGDKLLLHERAEGKIKNAPLKLTLADKKIVVIHEHHLAEALAESGQFDLVIYGHTHEPVVKHIKNTLLLNPGELCGWLYGKPSVALVDLNKMKAEIIQL